MTETLRRRGAGDLGLDRRAVRAGLALVALELLSVAAYFALSPDDPGRLRYLLYPFVWINAGLWAVARTRPQAGSPRHRWLAVAVAVGYFLVVMAVPGNIGLGHLDGHVHLGSVRLAMASPGWGPILAYEGLVRLYLIPFEVVGYLALSYLVYANALSLTRGALGGALGVATCVGCTVPVAAPLLGLLGGPTAGLVTTAYAYSYDLGTALFVLTLAVLHAGHRRDRA